MNEQIRQLREAVRLSPDNIPLRTALAETLLGQGFTEEAVTEYREALKKQPDDPELKLGLARAFHADGKSSQALVIVEDLAKSRRAPPRTHVLHARLLAGVGEIEEAVRRYKRGVDEDPSVADPQLARRLGIRPSPPHPDTNFDGDEAHEWDDGSEVVEGRIRAAWEGVDEDPTPEVERPRITFDDVGGMEDLKEEVRLKVIYPMEHPEMYEAYGKGIGGGILMYGPPGCGKTHLARATAGEVNAGFIAVGIHEVLDMWIGNSERNLHELFERARRHAPCVLFFDEVDALGASRSDMKTSAGRHLINQFLSELDGVETQNEGVLVLGATNAPWHLDSAFRRPGRFDRILFVPPPDADARGAILRLLLRGKPQDDIDVAALAKKTDGFSGADLKAVVDVTV
ncbi:MAG: AAA family ATPase, partial [Longimicrobiales bacterium]|nr:AAA family ATPase [Longimicrobiales bacterium]